MRIGVFDSGFGGLSILRQLLQDIPDHEYVYLADNKNIPYGDKSSVCIQQYTHKAINYLLNTKQCDVVIIACNTASAHYNTSDERVIFLIPPTIQALLSLTEPGDTVGVFSTQATHTSQIYANTLLGAGRQCISVPCPALVSTIETRDTGDGLCDLVGYYTKQMIQQKSPDIVVLGCTHYELLRPYFIEHLPVSILIISQPKTISTFMIPLITTTLSVSTTGSVEYLFTGDGSMLGVIIPKYLSVMPVCQHVVLS